jgi:hypothetical protein
VTAPMLVVNCEKLHRVDLDVTAPVGKQLRITSPANTNPTAPANVVTTCSPDKVIQGYDVVGPPKEALNVSWAIFEISNFISNLAQKSAPNRECGRRLHSSAGAADRLVTAACSA